MIVPINDFFVFESYLEIGTNKTQKLISLLPNINIPQNTQTNRPRTDYQSWLQHLPAPQHRYPPRRPTLSAVSMLMTMPALFEFGTFGTFRTCLMPLCPNTHLRYPTWPWLCWCPILKASLMNMFPWIGWSFEDEKFWENLFSTRKSSLDWADTPYILLIRE